MIGISPLETEADPNIQAGPLRWGRPGRLSGATNERILPRACHFHSDRSKTLQPTSCWLAVSLLARSN